MTVINRSFGAIHTIIMVKFPKPEHTPLRSKGKISKPEHALLSVLIKPKKFIYTDLVGCSSKKGLPPYDLCRAKSQNCISEFPNLFLLPVTSYPGAGLPTNFIEILTSTSPKITYLFFETLKKSYIHLRLTAAI